MEAAAYRAAKAQVVEHMLQGHPWHEAVAAAGLRISRSTAYQLLKRVRTEGEVALIDGRHGHPTKLRLRCASGWRVTGRIGLEPPVRKRRPPWRPVLASG